MKFGCLATFGLCFGHLAAILLRVGVFAHDSVASDGICSVCAALVAFDAFGRHILQLGSLWAPSGTISMSLWLFIGDVLTFVTFALFAPHGMALRLHVSISWLYYQCVATFWGLLLWFC